jgi:hypothetical protein
VARWRAWWSLLKVGGHLCLYLPHRDLYPNIGTEGANPDHKHDFVPRTSSRLWSSIAMGTSTCWSTRRATPMTASTASCWSEEASCPTACGPVAPRAKPEKTVCVVRYGGFGDMIQTAGDPAGLKREGFHVTVMTTPKGQEVLRTTRTWTPGSSRTTTRCPTTWLGDFWRVRRPSASTAS